MKTRVQIFQVRVGTDEAFYKGKKVMTLDWDEQEFVLGQWHNVRFSDSTQILFWDSNFWEIMYDNDYFIDYLPAVQVCNEINVYAPLWFKACCAVSENNLQFVNEILNEKTL